MKNEITDQKIEEVLYSLAEKIRPPKKYLEQILDSLEDKEHVTNFDFMRYNYYMGIKFALPLGLLAIALIAFLVLGKNTNKPQLTSDFPSTVNSQNADSALNTVDESISKSLDQMDQDFKTLDNQESSDSDLNSL